MTPRLVSLNVEYRPTDDGSQDLRLTLLNIPENLLGPLTDALADAVTTTLRAHGNIVSVDDVTVSRMN